MQETRVWSLTQEDPTRLGTTKPVSHKYWVRALAPRRTAPELMSRSHWSLRTQGQRSAASGATTWEARSWRAAPTGQNQRRPTRHWAPTTAPNKFISRIEKKPPLGTSLAVQRLRSHASSAGDLSAIPGWRTNIPHATQHDQKLKKKKKKSLLIIYVGNNEIIKNDSKVAWERLYFGKHCPVHVVSPVCRVSFLFWEGDGGVEHELGISPSCCWPCSLPSSILAPQNATGEPVVVTAQRQQNKNKTKAVQCSLAPKTCSVFIYLFI